MTDHRSDEVEVLRAIWQVQGSADELRTVLTSGKTCKNMKHVSFDDMAEPGVDVGASWRERLRREGKWDPSASSLRDLVLPRTESD
jgi:hypothetical protein